MPAGEVFGGTSGVEPWTGVPDLDDAAVIFETSRNVRGGWLTDEALAG